MLINNVHPLCQASILIRDNSIIIIIIIIINLFNTLGRIDPEG